MAPGRPAITVGIQPQTMWYGVILGTVCAFGWYTEKYRRDEEDIDHRMKKMYLQSAQEAQSKMPHMAAAIRGQSMELDGHMDKMVWGGKAKLKHSGGSGGNDEEPTQKLNNNDDDDERTVSEEPPKRRKKKRKKKKGDDDEENTRRQKEEAFTKEQQQKLVLQSSIAGVAVGAVAVAAVSAMMGGGMGGGRK